MSIASSEISAVRSILGISLLLIASSNTQAQDTRSTTVYPASDPTNSGNWILREDISDEFEGDEIDQSKWFVEGQNGEYYIWKGRAPSQFAPHNVFVEDGKLKIRSQWEPDFDFAKDEGHEGNTYRTHEGKDVPVTTGGVISRKRFLNGYMEVKSKPGDSAMTAAFWAIGYESELDVYEQMGNPNAGNDIEEDSTKMSVHDWQPPAERPTRKFGYKKKLPYRLADDFHVFGCEWGEDYLKCFIDGELVYETTQEKEGKHWVLTNPLEIWLDSEIFVWLGLPTQEELPSDFEIEYVRVWQKPQTNLLDRAFFGFEGPYLFQENERPLDLVPESSANNRYQQFWRIDQESSKHFEIVRHETFASGTRSLRFTTDGEMQSEVASVVGPEGSVDLPAGDYELTTQVWIDPKSTAKKLQISFTAPAVELLTIDLAACEKGEWVTVTHRFSLERGSTDSDRMKISLNRRDVPSGSNLIYLDDITIERFETSL
ncbi:family 16 glycosylhydrolase [Aporhodopirellula aestuarii]|uniref:Family 16 glycosylhydrolase n=1 Tax=Aporhodopirellula aestuarii TaxID=2950107 RepID=A0ABT0U2N5_9BACT|nr:family 16 glycosylhydrolase [Aporhodopirellula aestuarii]MCM2371167.1 family 16 glycosylhydrolase [Aporhodopirellula aestuarii]